MIAHEVCDEQDNCQRLYWIGVVSPTHSALGFPNLSPTALVRTSAYVALGRIR